MDEIVENVKDIPGAPIARMYTSRIGAREVLICGPSLAYWVHWIGKRSLPCRNGLCPRDVHRKPCQLISYYPAAYVASEQAGERVFGRWTPIVFPASIELRARIERVQMAGQGAKLIFATVGAVAGLRLREVCNYEHTPKMPGPFNVLPTLYRAWGLQYADHVIRAAIAFAAEPSSKVLVDKEGGVE